MELDRPELLRVADLSVQYKTDSGVVKAVNSVSFSIGQGETLGLVGETGAGKTTTALALLRVVPDPPGKITGGSITFKGEPMLKKSKAEMRKIRGGMISMIFQDPMTALNPVLTVGEQISEVIYLHQKASNAQAVRKAQEMLELVGITGDRVMEYPHQFSGGMKQRVVIAMALACNPSLLIADEPTTALDVTIQAQVIELMARLKRELGTSMLMITHDLGIVADICDRVAIMYAGRIIECGTLKHIFMNASHPYTVGLFGSIPNLKVKIRRLNPIEGLMPDPTCLPVGCAFYPRCSRASGICAESEPEVSEISPGHEVKCHLFTKAGL